MELLGQPVFDNLEKDLIAHIENLKKERIIPTLALIKTGENKSNNSYEKGIKKLGETLGINILTYEFLQEDFIDNENFIDNNDDIALQDNQDNIEDNEKGKIKEKSIEKLEQKITNLIHRLNEDDKVNGILIFQPLLEGLDREKITSTINQIKDIDSSNEKTLGDFFVNYGRKKVITPCTPESVMTFFNYYNYDLEGKNVVILGRSLVVGKPLFTMILNQNANVTICHSKTKEEDLLNYLENADIIISAVGKHGVLPEKFFEIGKKKSKIFIDVGINFEKGKLVGDFHRERIEDFALAYTPVPRGIGKITTMILMKHLIEQTKIQNNIKI